jgi:hypothetical protein
LKRNNNATEDGGGFHAVSGGGEFLECTWNFNAALFSGGSVYIVGKSVITFEQNVFASNLARNGGAISYDIANNGLFTRFINCTIRLEFYNDSTLLGLFPCVNIYVFVISFGNQS